jgi:hypothetical protein
MTFSSLQETFNIVEAERPYVKIVMSVDIAFHYGTVEFQLSMNV